MPLSGKRQCEIADKLIALLAAEQPRLSVAEAHDLLEFTQSRLLATLLVEPASP